MNARLQVPKPYNETVLDYSPGSKERKALQDRIKELKAEKPDIPLVIGGKEVRTGKRADCRSPYDHGQLLGRHHLGGAKEARQAVQAALTARKDWARMPYHSRAAIFLKAADMLAKDWRWTLNGATMLCQSKNAYQAEIDSACELIDFWRYNAFFGENILAAQPNSVRGMWNQSEARPLEGFVFAVSPFNFTAIMANLPTAPALMGNTVVWKPAESTMFTAWHILRLLKAAGLPDGVINMVAGAPGEIGQTVMDHPDLAGVHFTGSTKVFQWMWATAGANITKYKTYPRLVGETGGKDFVLAHPSADAKALAVALARGAFEFQGQKCSAASRAYVPEGLWPEVKKELLGIVSEMKMGTPEDFTNFINAVIDKPAYERIKGFIERAKGNKSNKILCGGKCDDSKGFFIEPTVVLTSDPKSETMTTEIFGPVLTIYVYKDKKWKDTLKLVDSTSPYALTGAVFSQDREALLEADAALVNAAGNYYINDKPTGAVVGQQPFGGARASGTNDKAGSPLNLQRWVSARTIKETFDPPRSWRYPFLDGESSKK